MPTPTLNSPSLYFPSLDQSPSSPYSHTSSTATTSSNNASSNHHSKPRHSTSKRSSASNADGDAEAILKRHRNTIAARKYRQKRLDRITELEGALAAMTNERDELKLKLARAEAEVSVVRGMMGG